MMYAFGNRPDFAAWDEPFYAAYLAATGIEHPMREHVLTANECDPQRVAERCLGPVPEGCPHFYMKHMPFHMEPDFPLDWAQSCVNIHLIRHPARVVASYVRKRENPVMRDIGFEEQLALFEKLPGPVVDSADILQNPEAALRRLCEAIRLEFDPSMLSWPAGSPSRSTGFGRRIGTSRCIDPPGFRARKRPCRCCTARLGHWRSALCRSTSGLRRKR